MSVLGTVSLPVIGAVIVCNSDFLGMATTAFVLIGISLSVSVGFNVRIYACISVQK